ncbi:MAG: undecaprenyl/decaprenyl-phosphate alpha-N-acetylglucosaminyl 1-phosphate transferase [Crocinitomicaceae bacterium]|jgi:UDP-GlcNAc:undecaprenyl-phosphate GlcNAc-1-phosphate transferase|nr:undecaprenyl/decaprenyl-phosphate alpha-N-acetylglucosaminyl 1-phosphate transferase [Crocinitomicaceae bacterium]MCF8410633.1 undecaprenyl/decaprenyl-phosphate alpha-N-acetylglucosaminyl 1-phosphate transferase [Crocinitomicaceae bacterium]
MPNTTTLHYLLFFLGAATISVISNILLLRFSQSLGIRNKNDVFVRWSNQSKPSLGGISLFAGFLFSTFLSLMIFPDFNIFGDISYVGLFLSASLAFTMGLADDAYNTKPFFKLFTQIFCGIIFLLTDIKIDLFHIPLIDSVLTVVWVITLMNSLNMLDNMDGITATTVFFTLLACLTSCYVIGNPSKPFWLFTIVAMLGALVGFLYFNVNPSKLFMGDAGSQFVGLFVAFFSIKYLWNLGAATEQNSWISVIITLVALTPAAADTLTVVINRLRAGKSPMVGGKDHTTHHLVYAGYSDKQVWYVFSIIGLFSFLFSVLIVYLTIHNIILPNLLFILFFLLVFVLLYRNTIKFKPKG